MVITKRINRFIQDVTLAAINEPESDVTEKECVKEYTDQILHNDYHYVVSYAKTKGIRIPLSLRRREK